MHQRNITKPINKPLTDHESRSAADGAAGPFVTTETAVHIRGHSGDTWRAVLRSARGVSLSEERKEGKECERV